MFDRLGLSKEISQIIAYSAGLIGLILVLALVGPWLLTSDRQPAPPRPAPPPRVEPAPAPQPTQIERIRTALAPEISAGSITVDPFGKWIAIRIGNLIAFDSGQATVLPQFVPVGQRIAQIVEKEKGPVQIVGHTDNQALSASSQFKDNQELSVARAKAVANLLQKALTDPSRLSVEGHGASEPIGDNGTPEGRAKNRRVEILITRSD